MRLAKFVKRNAQGFDELDELTPATADGVVFICPKCQNGHAVLCWFQDRGVPADETPGPGRWVPSGTSLADLTLTPSISLGGDCGWHGFVRNGDAA